MSRDKQLGTCKRGKILGRAYGKASSDVTPPGALLVVLRSLQVPRKLCKDCWVSISFCILAASGLVGRQRRQRRQFQAGNEAGTGFYLCIYYAYKSSINEYKSRFNYIDCLYRSNNCRYKYQKFIQRKVDLPRIHIHRSRSKIRGVYGKRQKH